MQLLRQDLLPRVPPAEARRVRLLPRPLSGAGAGRRAGPQPVTSWHPAWWPSAAWCPGKAGLAPHQPAATCCSSDPEKPTACHSCLGQVWEVLAPKYGSGPQIWEWPPEGKQSQEAV